MENAWVCEYPPARRAILALQVLALALFFVGVLSAGLYKGILSIGGAALFGAGLLGALGFSVFQTCRVAWRLEISDAGLVATTFAGKRRELSWARVGRVSLKDIPTWQGGMRIVDVASIDGTVHIRIAGDLPEFAAALGAIEARSIAVPVWR
jgi:hypothetical protein